MLYWQVFFLTIVSDAPLAPAILSLPATIVTTTTQTITLAPMTTGALYRYNMKKSNNATTITRDAYVKPLCKTRAIETGSEICNASVPDVEPGGDMDRVSSFLPNEEEKEGLWN